MSFSWHEVLEFIAAFLVGAVFLEIFLLSFQRARAHSNPPNVLGWAVKGGIGIAIIVVIVAFLFSK